jgi:pyruvate dehydrogenase E2 component (dihydrolipoamide acetyltransferase)
MAFEVTMPQMGADMIEGTLVKWIKQVGDHVERGDVLAEIETDKATVELEAYEAGELIKIVVEEGDVAPVGEVIALIGEASEETPDIERKPAAETPPRRHVESAETPPPHEEDLQRPLSEAPRVPAEEPAAAAPKEAPAATSTPPGDAAREGRIRISPVARRIATELGVDITQIRGSGPDGRILRRDVEQAAESAPQQPTPQPAPAAAPAAPRPKPAGTGAGLSRMRQAIARRMTTSKQTQPHYYLTLDIDMTDALAFRKQLNEAADDERRVSINDLIVKACAVALERHPKFNAEFADESLKMHERINICIGVALDEGLIAPAIMDCGSKTLGRIAKDAKDVIERAKGGRLRADEYSEGTFTITNLGAYGVEALIGIINPPQAAILGVGSVMARPAVVDGQVTVSQLMKVALSADHRVTDGAEGARFIKEIQGLLENPASLAL